MSNENIGIFNRTRFWCGAFDMRTLRVVEVHKYEECEKLGFNSYWAFNGDGQHSGEELFENNIWIFFYFARGHIELQIDNIDENTADNKTKLMLEGIKSYIKKQITIKSVVNRK